ncbi:hypothetical protein SEA_LUCKYBARNES_5 [Brevibacterium phage LuckyBarnes]|uniref:Uncharacterized protein n=1 Tax=Brevibacterium phage LuckyBarnes TaxID=2027888 RepID=A0A249XNL2_9CAUD|nr:hypothetical protein HOS02_gp05 [Brevibacterium phage LuckyBarnes]ASZ73326.1 hypothetical protein SEA_LUCKYBARNES_5 [Brevibacterium phage LuckyBarnes]
MSDWEPLRKLSLDEVGQRIDIRNRSAEYTNIVLTGIHVESEVIADQNMGGGVRYYPGRTNIRLESVDASFEVDQHASWRYTP